MNNQSNLNASLFATEHSYIEQRINKTSIIISLAMLLAGIFTLTYSLQQDDSGTTLTMLFMTSGTILVLTGLFRLFWKTKIWIYQPTESPIQKGSCYFDTQHLNILKKQLSEHAFQSEINATIQENGNIRMDYLISKDKKFAIAQLFQYVPYTYQCASPTYHYTGNEATLFINHLEKKQF